MDYINLHTHTFTRDTSVLEVVNQYPWEFSQAIPQYSIGIHPWYIKEERLLDDLKCIEEKLQLQSCLALGECGLDKRIEIPLEIQMEVFKQQIQLVQKTTKPIVLHCVSAFQEIIRIKNDMDIINPMIIHGFSKNSQVAQSLLNAGLYLSFGKYLMKNPDLESVFKTILNERIFLETDTLDEHISDVYKKAAHIKNISVDEMIQIVNTNFQRIFNNNTIV